MFILPDLVGNMSVIYLNKMLISIFYKHCLAFSDKVVITTFCGIAHRYERGSWRSFTGVSFAESPSSVCPSTSWGSTP